MRPKSYLLPLLCALHSCSHEGAIPFTQSGATRYPAKPISAVGVYRSVLPFQPFEEMGLITVTLPSANLDRIYEELRRGAAEVGADAVVGVKVDTRFHEAPLTKEVCVHEQACVPQTTCTSDDGACSTANVCADSPVCGMVTEPANTTTYLGIGTMIRRTR